MNRLKVTLPVMLHFEKEVERFLEAKSRLEALGERCDVPIEIGAFLPFMPGHARKPENFEKQLRNQEKHRLPIRVVETGIYHNNALSYVPGNPTYDANKPSDLERVLIQSSKLRDLDPTAPERLVVAPHVGIFVLESVPQGDFSRPSVYSPKDFEVYRTKLFDTSKEEFARLNVIASSRGLRLAVELSHTAVFENLGFWQAEEAKPEMDYQPFNNLRDLMEISGGTLAFDANHLASNQNVPGRMTANRYDPRELFATMGIDSWEEYRKRVGTVRDYLPHSHAIHISHNDGMGVRLKQGTDAGRCWGDGTGPDTTSTETYNLLLRTAQERDLPVAIEEDYNTKDITWREADCFLEPILQNYALSR